MTYTDDTINNWPDDSYAGRERTLADLLDSDTLEWYNTMQDYIDDVDLEMSASWMLFNMLMMHPAAAMAMTAGSGLRENHRQTLIQQIQEDANESSGDYFRARLDQRLTNWRYLKDIAAGFKTTES